MTPITADLILMVVNKIATAVHPDRIVLFGSWARGSAGPNSDMYLIVVESEPFTAGRSRRKETARIEMALKDLAAKNVVQLDDERKAAMVSNLMVVLCGESEVHPIVNAGTLYN